MVPSSANPFPADPRRARLQDALKHLHEAEYAGVVASMASMAGALHVSMEDAAGLTGELAGEGLAQATGSSLTLTDAGREQARQVLRAHRVYETYLASHTGVASEHWHREADAAEHRLTPEVVDELAARLGRPRFDPHGDPIPTRTGSLPPRRGMPLLECAVGGHFRVVHVEDEPAGVFRRAAAAGLLAGARLTLLDKAADFLRVAVESREGEIPLTVAAALLVEPCAAPPRVRPLSSLAAGEEARVVGLSRAIIGGERRRMLDLGLVPGTRVERGFDSMLGSPTAYLVRGAMIALRREQADRILVEA